MSKAPFDVIGDTLRGVRGMIMDMFRHPDEVLEACDRLAPVVVKWVTRRANPYTRAAGLHAAPQGRGQLHERRAVPEVLLAGPAARSSTASWPTGFVPYLFAEGAYGTRLETIAADLPKGRTVWQFDRTDMKKAKKVLGGMACIQGNVPLLAAATGHRGGSQGVLPRPDRERGPGGGFILDVGAVVDDAKPGNVEAMIQAAKESAK